MLEKYPEVYKAAMDEVAKGLNEANVPFARSEYLSGYVMRFPWGGDIVAHEASYGSDAGYVESYANSWDGGDVSVLSPAEAIPLIISEYAEFIKQEYARLFPS